MDETQLEVGWGGLVGQYRRRRGMEGRMKDERRVCSLATVPKRTLSMSSSDFCAPKFSCSTPPTLYLPGTQPPPFQSFQIHVFPITSPVLPTMQSSHPLPISPLAPPTPSIILCLAPLTPAHLLHSHCSGVCSLAPFPTFSLSRLSLHLLSHISNRFSQDTQHPFLSLHVHPYSPHDPHTPSFLSSL